VVTKRRLAKMEWVLGQRQEGLVVILDELYDPFNISAIFRTCDGLGITEVYIINPPRGFKPARSVCMKSHKWLKIERTDDREGLFSSLKKRGFKVYGTALGEDSFDFRDLPLTEKIAIVLGNEHAGIGEETKKLCDGIIHIPMYGFVQSFNVSVSAAIILSQITFRREEKGVKKVFSPEKRRQILEDWLAREKKKDFKVEEDFYDWDQSSSS